MLRSIAMVGAFCASTMGVGYLYNMADAPQPAFATAPVARGAISTIVRATGTVEAVSSVDVSSELSGKIAEVFVSFNDSVSAGQPIARLDQEGYLARVNEAEAALNVAAAQEQVQQAALERAKLAIANARTAQSLAEAQAAAAQARQDETKRDLERKLVLARAGVATEREVSQLRANRDAGDAELRASLDQVQMKAEAIAMAEAEAKMADANLRNFAAVAEQKRALIDQAKIDLERTTLRAPIGGIVIKRDVNPGQTVAVSFEAKTLFTIAHDLREMQVAASVDEADIGQVKPGQEAKFTVDAYPSRTFRGRVLQVRKAATVLQNVVTYVAIVSAQNPDLLLFPGMTAALRIVVEDTGDALTIPNKALRFHPKLAGATSPEANAAQALAPSEDAARVWTVAADGLPKPIDIGVGASDDDNTQVTHGPLVEGEPLIVGVADAKQPRKLFGFNLGR